MQVIEPYAVPAVRSKCTGSQEEVARRLEIWVKKGTMGNLAVLDFFAATRICEWPWESRV